MTKPTWWTDPESNNRTTTALVSDLLLLSVNQAYYAPEWEWDIWSGGVLHDSGDTRSKRAAMQAAEKAALKLLRAAVKQLTPSIRRAR